MMDELLRKADLFQGLGEEELREAAPLGKPRSLAAGEYLFLLGDAADRLYVVADGVLNLCFPMSLGDAVRDIKVEMVQPGQTLGWSALVKPFRFTLSARAELPSRVVGFPRVELLKLFQENPQIGYAVTTRISELIGIRLLTVQALWARGLQRTLENEKARDRS